MSRPPQRTFVRGLTLSADERHRAGYDTPAPGFVRVGRLIKCHTFDVQFPDGTEGECRYERLGPAYHRFDYRYEDGAQLPRQYLTRPLANVPAEIENRGQDLALDCFIEAIHVERTVYFRRISPPTDGSRSPKRERFAMTAKKAKELAGKYAVCVKVGRRLVPISSALYESIDLANHAWLALGMREWVVACLNRMDRCWEQPRYNPLHAQGHPKKEAQNA